MSQHNIHCPCHVKQMDGYLYQGTEKELVKAPTQFTLITAPPRG